MKTPQSTSQTSPAAKIWFLGAYGALAVLGWLLIWTACYPGLITPDSISQFEQARSFKFDDWHPPLMAGLWALALNFSASPASLFVPFITLYWGSLLLVAAALLRWSRWASAIAAVSGFFPVLINFSGALWKDVLVFVCLMMAAGLLLISYGRERRPLYITILAVVFGLTGALARYNSMLAAAPLLMLLLYPSELAERPFLALSRRLALSFALTAGVALSTQTILNATVFHPEKTGVVNALLLFDMVGVSSLSRENLVPGDWTPEEAGKIVNQCYVPEKWDGLAAGPCAFISQRVEESGRWKAGLFADWRRAVAGHPGAYLRHRANHLLALAWRPYLFFVGYTEQAALDWGFTENPYYRAMVNLLVSPAPVLAPFFKPGLWFGLSIVLTVWTGAAAMKRRKLAYPAFCMALSGFVYWTPLFFIGVANDFRYIYWTIGATIVSALVFASGRASAGGMADE